ncbi:MAG: hypothetical protein IJH75_00595 [Mogibacterium sp.]|nr:hypothetical protein [Mogibacterium sp.]
MGDQEILYRELQRAYRDKEYLQERGFSQEQARQLDARCRKAAADLLHLAGPDGRFSAQDVLFAWKTDVADSRVEPADGWLMHCYLYLRNILFPHLSAPTDSDEFAAGRESLLRFCRGVYEYERKVCAFDPTKDFLLLPDEEITEKGFLREYLRMRRLIRQHHVYEFMRIGIDITPFNTLGHVSGVHYVAMYVAKQLYQAGVPVDLGLVSAAAATHDIGKYGCRKHEERRVPYLHYYYTDYCLNRYDLPTIAHIAANHSTWDLELENLSAESLLLIYADFRTKSTREDGKEIIHFYSLKEAFDVILSKLDNVDEAKKHRYTRVYNKLRDFEEYMLEHGVRTEIADRADSYPRECGEAPVPVHRKTALLHGAEVAEQIKYRAVDHNIRLMSRFNRIEDFASLLEAARSETRWKNARTYINILSEYSTYMTDEQKSMTLRFLYEMLPHPESDIREQAATVMGKIVGRYRVEYKKELPEDIPAQDDNISNLTMFEETLGLLLYPDHKYTELHRKWISACTDFFVRSVVGNCRPSCRHRYFHILERYYDPASHDEERAIVMLSTALYVEPEQYPASYAQTVLRYCGQVFGRYSLSVDLIALDAIRRYDPAKAEETDQRRRALLGLGDEGLSEERLSAMFLDDLKTQTPWIVKVANIREMLAEADRATGRPHLMHIATHYANLIKVSETVTARREAGRALLQIILRMTPDQRNELMVELYNGLEIEDYQFSRSIPDYLGVVILYLPPKELDETIDELQKFLNAGNERTASAALNTIATALEHYAVYAFDETPEARDARRTRLIGMLLKGFAYYKSAISQEAFRTMGEHIFASSVLTLEEKQQLSAHLFKRLLTILPEAAGVPDLVFYNNAAVLNHIYRFVSEYQSEVGPLTFAERGRVAFFPGTFDPFSLGHKAIAATIRDMGFEVYLAIDEFSWSKKTLPHMLRKNILEMSIADEEDLYIFPDDVSINIANPKDLKHLRELFKGRELYMAVGSDVVRNASSYKKAPEEHSIHTFNHILFARESQPADEDAGDQYPISGKVLELTLQKYYEDISSTRIRENIDLGRDISTLIDPIVQNYIYDRNFYSREPAYKHVLQARELTIRRFEPGEPFDIGPLCEEVEARGYDYEQLSEYFKHSKVRKITLEAGGAEHRLTAFAAARRMETHELLEEFGSLGISAHIRRNSGGGIAVIGAFHAIKTQDVSNLRQILLTELLTALLAKDYAYAVYHPVCAAGMDAKTIEAFVKQGFVNISEDPDRPVYAVDMRDPIVIFRDVETVVKAPLNKNPRVQQAIDDAHDRLLQVFREIYPGKLLVSFNTSAVYSKIVDLVAKDNGVSTTPDPQRRRGPYLSVPFGKALSDVVVPNTVTKAMRTEKYFKNDLSGFTVREMRDYQTLEDQARTLRSFDRPVILIDDLLHSGQRMNNIDPILRMNDVEVHKVIVGLLTGNAQDNMAIRHRPVESAYFIPSISLWINERDCYPFIGGDSIELREGEEAASINLILPYTSLSVVCDRDSESSYKYSMTCLENAQSILRVLEEEYQATFEKKLTLRRLGAVITHPRRPLLGSYLEYDEHIAPSDYIENDIRRARRLNLFRRQWR